MYSVSIVIPTYNRGELIKKTIESVLTQTYQKFEVIVVDDGSTDDTPAIVASIAEKDQRIRYLRHDINRGAQAARKAGVRAARGELIAFLDSDDEWYPDKLQKQVTAFENLPDSVGVVHGDSDIYYVSTGKKRRFMVPKLNGSVYKTLLQTQGPLYQCMLVRRECFVQIPDAIDTDVPAYQEWDTSINLARKYEFHFIDEPLMVYNIHKGETISGDSLKGINGYLYVVEKHRNEILEYCGKRSLGNHYFSIALTYYLLRRDKSNAKKYFNMAREYGFNYPRMRTLIYYARLYIAGRIGC